MAITVASAVARFKSDPAEHLDHRVVHDACAAAGHAWRERVLGPVETVGLLLLQVLHGNVSCRALCRISGVSCTAEAYCQARARLPIGVLRYLLSRVTRTARDHTRGFGRWLGHRVVLLDGSGASMPDTPGLRRAFGVPGRCRPGLGFPVMHVLWLFDAATGLIVDHVASRCHTHDLAHAATRHPQLEPGDVLVGDRAFGTYAYFACVSRDGLHLVARMHQRRIVSFKRGRKPRARSSRRRVAGMPAARQVRVLGREDQLVEARKPREKPAWMSETDFDALPDTLTLRELRYRITRPGFRTRRVTLATTLLDPRKYPKAKLAELYRGRWEIETNLKHLKQTLGLNVLHCKTHDGVMKELLAYILVYNLVRMLILAAATQQGVPPGRISFIDALDVLRHRPPDESLPSLAVHPNRPGRAQPRCIKRPKDRYPYLTRPRQPLAAPNVNA